MMNIETLLGIVGAFGGLEALKWLASLKSTRRKAAGEAAESFENVITKRVKTYEDSILFLQNQLQDKERQFAELSSRYQAMVERELRLTRELGEMKLKYKSSRCDRKECENRKPPFSWLKRKTTKNVAALLIMGLSLCTASCSRKVYVPVESVRIEKDSTVRSSFVRDSIIIRDSVLVLQRGDTVFKESWRIRERMAIARDTLYSERCDTVVRPVIVEVEKKGTAKNKAAMLTAFIVAGILLAVTVNRLLRR